MYNKLLISAGGGIISRLQQAEQDDCATIAIGLGGTGISCLRSLKKEIFTRVKPDSGSSLVATYKHIKFLAVDTDRSSIGDTGSVDTLDGNTEFFNISCPDIHGLLANAHLLQQDASLQWLITKNAQQNGNGLSIHSAEAGAGGVRQIGRLLLLQNCQKFVTKLTHMITEARTGLMGNPNINIHIFTGLGGGTGAGTFLDVCYIVQHVLGQLGLAGQAYTCGYFFLPDVNLAKGVTNEYIKSNGFASMKELDYVMNYDNNGGQWDQQYDGFRVTTQEPPVKLAHLITATDSNGAVRENGYDYAMHVAVDYVLEYIIKPYVDAGDDVDNDGVFSIKSHISNVNQLINGVSKRHGACYNYCVLGAANAYLPYKEITTYLTSKIFEGFGALPTQLPLGNAIDNFVTANQLRYEDLFRQLTDKLPAIPLTALDHKELYEQTEGITNDTIPHLLTPMRDATSKISGKLEENRAAMLDTDASPLADSTSRVASVYARVKQALIGVAAEPDKGPYYAGCVLHNLNANDLGNVIRGYIKQAQENLSKALADLNLRDNSMSHALGQLQSSNALNRKGRAQDYISATHAYFAQRSKIDQIQMFIETLKVLEQQLADLYSGFFGIFANIMTNLQDTFDDNRRTLAEPILEDHSYAMKLMTIQDLQASLDASVADMKIGDMIHNFVVTMLNNPDAWVSQDENKICDAVTRFFLDQLQAYTEKTIVHYLQLKFGTTEPAALEKKVYDEIMLPLGDRSAPLFWIDTGIHKLSDAKPLGYLSVPNISSEIKAAAANYMAGHEGVRVRKAQAADRITIFRFLCGMPLYAYKGVGNYKGAYIADMSLGKHLYEGSVGDARDSRKMINIFPISTVDATAHTTEEKDNLAFYAKAWDLGVLTKVEVGNAVDIHLNVFDADYVARMETAAAPVIQSADAAKAKVVLENINTNPVPVTSFKVMPNNGTMDAADIVIRDHIVGSLAHMELLRAQVALLDRVQGIKDALAQIIDKTAGMNKNVRDFAMALMTGVIEKADAYTYSLVHESFGLKDSVELTTIDSEPFGMALPLYSAFVNFCALSADQKATVDADVKNNLRTNAAVVDAALADLTAFLTVDRVNAFMNTAKTSYPDEFEAIKAFFQGLNVEVRNFANMR